MIEKEKFCNELITRMKSLNPEVKNLKITENTSLISEGILDSMSLVELMTYVEELIGTPIDFDNFEMEDAQSLSSLYKSLVLPSKE